MPNSLSSKLISARALRGAGYVDEADCLDDAVRRARVWRRETPEHVIALSLFGSVKFDEMLSAIGGMADAA